MSRTYRYDPDGGAARPARKRDRSMPGILFDSTDEYAWRPEGGASVSAEEAIRLMKPRVDFMVDLLVGDGYIAEHEREDFASIVNCHIWRVLPGYDPDRVGSNGRKAGIGRYLTVCVNSVVMNIRQYLSRKKRRAAVVPCSDVFEKCEASGGAWTGGDLFGDRCRSAERMTFCMDVDTLFSMLGRLERESLRLRIEDWPLGDVADALTALTGRRVTRRMLYTGALRRIRAAALKCGFEPHPGALIEEK